MPRFIQQTRALASPERWGQLQKYAGLMRLQHLLRHAVRRDRDWEVRRLPVVVDSAYGNSFEFREQLRQRELSCVMAVEPQTVV
jgi:hypothetical protein